MKSSTDFAKYLSSFLQDYLPKQKGASPNTIKSYSYTFILFMYYMRDVKMTPINKLDLNVLTKTTVVDFLEWLQENRKCNNTTRNQRLSAISSFTKYIEYQDPSLLNECQQIKSIPLKATKQSTINYLSADDLRNLFSHPDTNKPKGLRDLALLSLMYESGARVQEIITLTPSQIFVMNKPYRVVLHGKGNKERVVPLPEKMATIIMTYMKRHELLDRDKALNPLFPNQQGRTMTRNGVNNILVKYANMAHEKDVNIVPKNISCHTLRHSKAMQLLESKVELLYIRDFLGHKSVLTTEIYARANPKHTFEAIKNAYKNVTKEEIPIWKGNTEVLSMLRALSKR